MRKQKCNKACICLSCYKSCMKACKNCNADFKMAVKACLEYSCGCTQLNLSDFLNEVEEITGKRKQSVRKENTK